MMKSLVAICSLMLAANAVGAQELKVSDETLAPYKIKRGASGNPIEPNAAAGQRFMTALEKRDAEIAAVVRDAVRYEIQDTETKKFARQKRFVLIAYGVIWTLLAGFALAMWLRQRQLAREIRGFEARFSDDEDESQDE